MKKLFPWFSAATIIVIVFGTIYSVSQQGQRREANYPQIQLAEDIATELNQGVLPATVVTGKVNMASSLAPFVIVYDLSGQPIAGSGFLNNKLAAVPLGVLVNARGHNYSFVTWQPQVNLRIAAVSVAANKYFVLSGRSLVEVEKNETNSLELSLFGGLLALLALKLIYITSGQFNLKSRK